MPVVRGFNHEPLRPAMHPHIIFQQKSHNLRLIYTDITISNLSAVRHLGKVISASDEFTV